MKPPFDPLNAGWVYCPECQKRGRMWGNWYPAVPGCPTCDGLGIVVGPPRDGIRVRDFLTDRRMMHPTAKDLFTRLFWSRFGD